MKIPRRSFLEQISICTSLAIFPAGQYKSMDTQGIKIRTSPFGVKETIDRLVIFLEKHGATVYTRINQQNEVRHSGREIAPVEFILFGNPANGGAIMAANPLAALDLPLKIIAWENEEKMVSVAYNDPVYIQHRYTLCPKLVAAMNLAPLIDQALA
jgi:uncharacterized protein (DUF302 family)